jgi:hypothetical protein
MALPIADATPLNIPGTAFNDDGLAVLAIPGGRYGGDWSIGVMAGDVNCGKIFTSVEDHRKQALQHDPGYPDLAIETAFTWLAGQAREHGWRLVSWESFNNRYGPGERPYFCLAQAIVANETFTPKPGVTYADNRLPAEAS